MFRSGTSRASIFGALALFSLLLAGCGGSGGGDSSPSNLTRTAVIDLLQTGVKQSANLSTSTTRGKKSPSRKVGVKATREHEEEGSGFYQDESLGLWVEPVQGQNEDPTAPSGERYWVDHEKTRSGGHSLRWAGASGVFPVVLKSETTYTAGQFAGNSDLREDTINEDESGSVKGSGVIRDEVKYSFTGSWAGNGQRTFSERAEFADGSWQTYTLSNDAEDLSYDLTIVSSLGVTYKLHMNDDLTGSGTIEGPHEGLPAKLVWDGEGIGTITWSDGTTSPFNLYGE